MRIFAAVYKCSNCQSLIKGVVNMSGNTINGISFSDTYVDAPMKMPEGAGYIGCANCKNVFEKNKLEIIKQYEWEMSDADKAEYNSAPEPLSDFDTLKILLEDQKFDSSENNKKFSLWYLWHFNHNLKPEEKGEEIENGNYKKYTNKLIDILSSEKDNVNSEVLKAEILRERGEFDKSEEMLNSIDQSKFNSVKIQYVFDEMKKRIAQKDNAVFETEKKPDFIK